MNYTINDRKFFPSTTGVYCIYFKNSKSNKIYVGSASRKTNNRWESGFYNRWKSHIYRLRKNISYSPTLQNAYNKYNQENMIFKILEECDPSECLIREQFYIDKFDSYKHGYNGRPLSNSNLGFKQTDFHNSKIINDHKLIRDTYYPSVKKLYDDGKTTYEISKLLNISRGFITKIFRENNIKPRKLMDYKKKKIYQFDMKGNFIKEWSSINECSRDLGLNSHGIGLVLHNKCKHFKGFYFNFLKIDQNDVIKNINEFIIKSKNRKYLNIKQINKNGDEIKTWRDVKEIVEHYNFSNTYGICHSLKSNKLYKGFHWKLS